MCTSELDGSSGNHLLLRYQITMHHGAGTAGIQHDIINERSFDLADALYGRAVDRSIRSRTPPPTSTHRLPNLHVPPQNPRLTTPNDITITSATVPTTNTTMRPTTTANRLPFHLPKSHPRVTPAP